MGAVMAWFRRNKPSSKATTPEPYFRTSVTAADATRSPLQQDLEAAGLVERLSGYVDICASLNARYVSCNPLRLYRPRPAFGGGVRGMSRRAKSYVRGDDGMPRCKYAAQMAEDVENYREVASHPILDLLDRPSPDMHGSDYRYACEYSQQVTGDATSLIVSGADGIAQLRFLLPSYVRVLPDPSGERLIHAYAYGREQTGVEVFEPEEIDHRRYAPDLTQPYTGRPPLMAVWQVADMWTAITRFLTTLSESEGRPEEILTIKGGGFASEVDFQSFVQKLYNKFKSSYQKGLPLVLDLDKAGDVARIPLGHSPKDMTNVELLEEAERSIGNAFGVPESVFRMNDANLASSTTGNIQYLRYTVLPRANREADYWTQLLHRFYPGTEDWYFAPDNPVPEDSNETVQRLSTLAGGPVMTVNEARESLGLDSVEGGDELRNAPGAEQAAPSPFGFLAAPQPTEQKSIEVRLTDPEHSDAANPTPRVLSMLEEVDSDAKHFAAVAKSGSLDLAYKSADIAADFKSAYPDDERFRNSPDFQIYEMTLRHFNRQRDAILERMADAPFGITKSGPPTSMRGKSSEAMAGQVRMLVSAWYGESASWAKSLHDEVSPVSAGVADEEAAKRYERVQSVLKGDLPASASLTNEAAQRYMQQLRIDSWRSMSTASEGTRLEMAKTLNEGLQGGESFSSLRDRVRGIFDAETASAIGGETRAMHRAALIARTETTSAQVRGTLAGYAGTSVVEGKRWVALPGACQFCRKMEQTFSQQSTALDSAFVAKGTTLEGVEGGMMKLDYREIDGPPLHPFCRCDVQPILIGD